jgi:periplasmic protein TonB
MKLSVSVSATAFQQEVSSMQGMMFADAVTSSGQERLHRGWTTLGSFALQIVAASILLLIPILRPSGLPSFHHISTPISIGDVHEETHLVRSQRSALTLNREAIIVFRPTSHPQTRYNTSETNDAPPIGGSGPFIAGTPNGDRNEASNLFTSGTRPVLPIPSPTPSNRTIRLSHISEGNLVRKVQPVYPALARSARIQGVVVLEATISKQGAIENLRLLSGHPMLAPSAIDAVRQWRYKPYILNGQPVEVETQITVNFALNN